MQNLCDGSRVLAWAGYIFSLQGNSYDLYPKKSLRHHAFVYYYLLHEVQESNKESQAMNVDDFIKKENDIIIKRQKEIDERKKQEKELAKMELLANLGIEEKQYGEGNVDRKEYPFWDNEAWRPYKVEINVSDEEFARLQEHLKQTDNPHYIKYIKQIRKIEERDKPLSKPYKIILTVVSIVVFVILTAVVTGIRTDAGYVTPGILGTILLMILVFVLRSIWKKNKK